MEKIIREHHISFKNAFNGLRYAFSSQPNFRIHFLLSALALLAGWFLGVSFWEMTVLVLTVVLGLTVEMMNTAVESITDLITHEWRLEAKIAKDVSAGMMLLTAFGATLVAILILGPKIMEKFS